ncbi:MAG: alpha/beta hydrolase [Pseudomonadota bacterium]
MRVLRWAAVALVTISTALIATLWSTGHELGPRRAVDMTARSAPSDIAFIEANGVRFGYLSEGRGPLVLLFHGYPETLHSWRAVQRRLAAAGYRAVAVGMRGYPPSEAADDYAVAALGRDVVALIDAFGARRAAIVGHDWGASAVYEAAFIAPEKIAALVGMSVPHPLGIEGFDVIGEAPHFLYYQSPFAERLVWSHDFQHVRDIYALWAPTFETPDAEVQNVIAAFEQPGAIDAALAYYRALFWNGDDNRRLGPSDVLSTPALVIAGDRDGAAPLALFEKAAPAFIGPYTPLTLRDVGHFPQLEAPGAVADAMIAFFAAHYPPAGPGRPATPQ